MSTCKHCKLLGQKSKVACEQNKLVTPTFFSNLWMASPTLFAPDLLHHAVLIGSSQTFTVLVPALSLPSC